MPNVFDNSIQVLINGKVVDSIVTSTGGVLYERLHSSFLSIDVPLNLVYSDAFLINGTLTDKNNNGIVGETVKLKVGSTVVDSTTTTTNGAYSFTKTPVSTGNHTFQVIYDGSEEYSESESSIVERVVGKETTVLSLTNPVNNSSVYTDGSISVNGVLVTDDNEKLSNKSIVVKEGNTTITTFTTNSNGVFTGSITGLNVGTHSLTFQFVSDSNYSGSSVDRTVIVNTPLLSLSATKNTLTVGETVTFTATYTGAVLSGRTVVFKAGNTTLATETTDSNGRCTFTYSGGAMGNVTITAECMSLQKNYLICDAQFYDIGKSSNYTDIWTCVGLSLTRGSDYSTLTETTAGTMGVAYFSQDYQILPSDVVSLDFNQVDGSTSDWDFFIRNSTNTATVGYFSMNDINVGTDTFTYIRIAFDNANKKCYVYGGGASTPIEIPLSATDDSYRLYFSTPYAITTLRFKNVKVYPSITTPHVDLFADKPVISLGESSTITAKLHDYNGVSGKSLSYTVKHGTTTINSGTLTTNSNGEANITYTGTGIGDVDVIVSYSNIQETYELKDCIAFDSAILNDTHLHNEYWIKQYSSLVADITNNGTSILGGGGGQGYFFNKPSTTSSDAYDWDNNICIEFDVYELVGNPYFQIIDASNNNGSYFLSSVGVTDGSHVKIIFTDENTDNFRIIVDGIEKSTKTINNTDLVRMGFVVSTTTGLTFKNFVVYSYTYDLLFYDNASTDKSSKYTGYLCEGGTHSSISYTNNQYSITGGSKTTARLIDSIGQLENCEITLKAKPTSNSFSGAIGVAFGTGTGNIAGVMAYTDTNARKVRYANSTWQENYSSYFNNSVAHDTDGWVTLHITKQGTNITANFGENDFTFTLPFNQCYIGIMIGTGTTYFKEVKIKAL